MTNLTKLELHKSRLKTLAEIDRLDKLCCELCIPDNGSSVSNKSYCKCEAAIEIRKLGSRLSSLTSKRKSDDAKPAVLIKQETFDKITVECYKKMKSKNIGDRAVAKYYGVSSQKLVDWKTANGLRMVKEEKSIVKSH